jgi:hypothetical protein
MSNEFKVHRLNEDGLAKADQLAQLFTTLLAQLDRMIPTGRERAIVVTKLQEAAHFAKMALALQKGYQVDE